MKPNVSFSDEFEMSDNPGRMRRMPFLSTGRSVGSRFYNFGRHFRHIAVFLIFAGIIVWVFDTWVGEFPKSEGTRSNVHRATQC